MPSYTSYARHTGMHSKEAGKAFSRKTKTNINTLYALHKKTLRKSSITLHLERKKKLIQKHIVIKCYSILYEIIYFL